MGVGFKSWASLMVMAVCLSELYQAQTTSGCNQLDIVFIMDGSASVIRPNWNNLKVIMENSLQSLEIAPDRINAGLVVFSSDVSFSTAGLSGNRQDLISTVQGLTYPNSGTSTNLAIDRATEMLRTSRSADVSPDVIVIITDGSTDTPAETVASVQAARDAGITIYAIGFGPYVQVADLSVLAEGTRLINAGDLANLFTALTDLVVQACQEVTTTTAAPITTSTTPRPTTLPPPKTDDLCGEAKMATNETGYVYHPKDCDKFIQCHFYPSGTVAVYRACPMGAFWDHAKLRCDQACNVDCPYEKCHLPGKESYNMEGSCRAHWRCEGFESRPACCPRGQAYAEGYGCVEDEACMDPCGLDTERNGTGVCREDRAQSPVLLYSRHQPEQRSTTAPYSALMLSGLLMHMHVEHMRMHRVQRDGPWTGPHDQSRCGDHGQATPTPPQCESSRFDLLTCSCASKDLDQKADLCRPSLALDFFNVTQLSAVNREAFALREVQVSNGVASFPGTFGSLLHAEVEDRVGRPLAFSLRYRETTPITGHATLLHSTSCEREGALSVTLNRESVTAKISSPNGQYAYTTVSTQGFPAGQWKNVEVIYDETSLTLTATYQNLRYVSRVDAPRVRCFTCGVDIAPGSSSESFVGDVQYARVSYCYPKTAMAVDDNSATVSSSGLRVTFSLTPGDPYAFAGLPRTVTAAALAGWTPLSGDCDSNPLFRGVRYVKDNDRSVVLLYDVRGNVAGIQSAIAKSGLASDFPPSKQRGRIFQDEGLFYTLTAYFMDPAWICSAQPDASPDSGIALYIQNGSDPVTQVNRIPVQESSLGLGENSRWTQGTCFPGMGVHYWYNTTATMSCVDFQPVFLLYDQLGHLTGFGWAIGTGETSPRFGHPAPSVLTRFWKTDQTPQCLYDYANLTTLHMYITDYPLLITC